MGSTKTCVRACVRRCQSRRERRAYPRAMTRLWRRACEATEVKETGETFIRFASARLVRSIAWPECGAMRRERGVRVTRE